MKAPFNLSLVGFLVVAAIGGCAGVRSRCPVGCDPDLCAALAMKASPAWLLNDESRSVRVAGTRRDDSAIDSLHGDIGGVNDPRQA